MFHREKDLISVVIELLVAQNYPCSSSVRPGRAFTSQNAKFTEHLAGDRQKKKDQMSSNLHETQKGQCKSTIRTRTKSSASNKKRTTR